MRSCCDNGYSLPLGSVGRYLHRKHHKVCCDSLTLSVAPNYKLEHYYTRFCVARQEGALKLRYQLSRRFNKHFGVSLKRTSQSIV